MGRDERGSRERRRRRRRRQGADAGLPLHHSGEQGEPGAVPGLRQRPAHEGGQARRGQGRADAAGVPHLDLQRRARERLPDGRRGGRPGDRPGLAHTSPRSRWSTRHRRPTARSARRSRPGGTRRPTRSSDRLRPGPLPRPPVRADAPRPPRHGRDAVRAAARAAGRVPAARARVRRRRQPRADGLRAARDAFCGIDLAGRAIERARRLASALGLDNVDSSTPI